MPANIATTNHEPAFAYFGEEPRHDLGQKLDALLTQRLHGQDHPGLEIAASDPSR